MAMSLEGFYRAEHPASYAICKGAVKQASQGTRGTARSRLRARAALGRCRASPGSAGVSVIRMHLAAGRLRFAVPRVGLAETFDCRYYVAAAPQARRYRSGAKPGACRTS